MTGQIPKYGEHFRLERGEYDPNRSHSIYRLREDPRWHIQSDKTSKKWQIYHDDNPISRTWPSLFVAMVKLLAGIDGGFFQVEDLKHEQQMGRAYSPEYGPQS